MVPQTVSVRSEKLLHPLKRRALEPKLPACDRQLGRVYDAAKDDNLTIYTSKSG